MAGGGMSWFKRFVTSILNKIYLPVRIQVSRPAQIKKALPGGSRYFYQKKFIDFNIPTNKDMDEWVEKYFAGKSDLKDILASLTKCGGI